MTFAKRPLRQRLLALVAAYAIALAGLVAGFGAAEVAAMAAAQPDAVLCHSAAAERPTPAPDENGGKLCIESCCIGCLAMAATVPPPIATPTAPHAFGVALVLPTRFVPVGGRGADAYRSRGPPPTL
jgi:hypothetical protein